MPLKRRRSNSSELSTHASHPLTNKTTLPDNSLTSKKRTRTTSSSPIPGAVSTSSGKGLKPFWTPLSTDWSKRLWSCTETDCVALGPTSWTPYLQKLAQNSWFTVHQTVPRTTHGSLPTTSLPLRQSLWRDITAGGPQTIVADAVEKPDKPKKPPPMRVRKFRVFPTVEQQQTIKTWMGAVRWTYNQTVTHLNSPETKGRQSIKEVRALCVNNEATRTAWAKNVPYDVRDEGARDAKKAVGSNMAKQRIRKKQGLSHCFKLRYRRKKFSAQETLVVHSKHWSHPRGLYYDLLGKSG